MNDFTKYDLHTLLYCIKYTQEKTTNCSDAMKRVKLIVENMIDNYPTHCEHSGVKLNEK